jgi:hypothetical protein
MQLGLDDDATTASSAVASAASGGSNVMAASGGGGTAGMVDSGSNVDLDNVQIGSDTLHAAGSSTEANNEQFLVPTRSELLPLLDASRLIRQGKHSQRRHKKRLQAIQSRDFLK